MLTKELLLGNEALAGLTEDQITAITTLSSNDENDVISRKTGEIYGGLDGDILSVSGMPKNGTEKTYDYAKRVIGEMKARAESAAELQSAIDSLKTEKSRLEKALEGGISDKETAKALKQAKADLSSVTEQYTQLSKKYNEEKEQHEKEILDIRINSEFDAAVSGLKFKPGISENASRVILRHAADKLKGLNPQYVDDKNGGKMLVFHDESGVTMTNPNNQLKPFTASELITRELETMGVLESVREQRGAGTNGRQTGGNAGSLDISGAKTRTEAHDIISKSLLSQGLTVGSDAYQDAMDQAWRDNNVSQLPEN